MREDYGALVAAYQARCAEDPTARAFFARIATDEARHAELSHAIAAWLEPTLVSEERVQIVAAKTTALAELRATDGPHAYASVAGLPPPRHARLLIDGLEREVLG